MTRFRELRFWLKHAVWFVPSAYVVNFIYAVLSDQTGGTFGDTFGAANALFSGTALLMLVLAVTLQREELQEVKDERKDTKKLLEGQEQLNEAQGRALERQLFEKSFETIMSSVFSEKALITKKTVVDNKEQHSELFNSAFAAARILERLAPDHQQTAAASRLLEDPHNALAAKADVYVNLLLVASEYVEKASPDEATREARQQLLKALYQEEVAYCTAWYLCRSVVKGEETGSLRFIFARLNLIDRIGEKQRLGLLHAIPDLLSDPNSSR